MSTWSRKPKTRRFRHSGGFGWAARGPAAWPSRALRWSWARRTRPTRVTRTLSIWLESRGESKREERLAQPAFSAPDSMASEPNLTGSACDTLRVPCAAPRCSTGGSGRSETDARSGPRGACLATPTSRRRRHHRNLHPKTPRRSGHRLARPTDCGGSGCVSAVR
jgi:hypothetical protein